jgi:hypothetical protein
VVAKLVEQLGDDSLSLLKGREKGRGIRCCIFNRIQPSYDRAVSDLDRSMNISLWVWVAHSSFTEGSYMTKHTASDYDLQFDK